MKQRTKESKKRLNSLILLVAFSAILLIASTYAWFSAQRDVTVANLEGQVEVSEGLEISLDADKWGQKIDMSALDWTGSDAYSGNKNYEPSALLPASSQGTAEGTGIKFYRGTAQGEELKSITQVTESSDAGIIAFDVFLRNSTKGESPDPIYLLKTSTATVLNSSNGGKYSSRTGVATTGLQNTVRVAIASYQGQTSATTANATTIISEIGTDTSNEVTHVAIWEPNANFHVPDIVTNYGSVLKVPANFISSGDAAGTYTITADNKIPTYALVDDVTSVDNTYDWTVSSKVAKQNVRQTTITVPTDGTMPTSYEMKETAGTAQTGLVLATDGSTQFTLPANTVTKARIYIWLEGQDIDCANLASHGGGIEVNLGLEKPSTES